jgi:HSP20 family protein
MTLIKWKNNLTNPATQNTFSDFFNDFFNDSLMSRDYFKSVPAVNISERTNDYMIEMAAPGFSKEDFKVNVDNEVLTISAEKKNEKKDENSRFTRKEFQYSSFSRTFTMPDHVEADKIGAEYKDGILSLALPKKEEAKVKPAREIKIS